MMEVAAATLAYQDTQLGRILDEIDREGERDNTLILFIEGDNGASGEAGPPGTSHEMGAIANGIKDDVDSLTAMLDEMGGPKRSAERRVGKECVSKCISRWQPDH